MPVSRPAVSQHLKVLKEAGLVTDRPEGTSRVYYIDPEGLGALRSWLEASSGIRRWRDFKPKPSRASARKGKER